ncbi:AAA family ATPase [Polymorphobacter sp.]|uniref:AAA family ATPase n=1 Tax=Polymorphobacter sp. TaxID=1909290 RepID=UPI003F7077F2
MTVKRPLFLKNGMPAMRVVDEIPPDAAESDFLPGVAARWQILTTPLTLHGCTALASPGFLPELEAAMPWHSALLGFVGREVALSRGCAQNSISLPPVILVGPPAAGKSHAARLIASHAGLGFGAIDVGGASDNRALAGTARGYTATTPAWPLVVMAAQQTGNPLLQVDEADKCGGSAMNGHPHHTLLSLLEPSTSSSWFDACLMAAADLGAVSWVLCANEVSVLPKALRTRLEIVELQRPASKWAGHVVERLALDLVVQLGLPPPASNLLLARGRVKTMAVGLHEEGGNLRDIRRLLRAALADHVVAIRRRLDH